jgi:hypothetical protein
MNCHGLDRWLDDGSPEELRVAAMAHARVCAPCLPRHPSRRLAGSPAG